MMETTNRLHFYLTGEGEAIIILHGLFGMAENWRSLALQLGEYYRVYALDLRNHGRSPQFPSHTYNEMVNDINEFIRHEGIQKATLIGHSMGGKVAMLFSGTYPEKVNKLIIVDIDPSENLPTHYNVIEGLKSINLYSITSRQLAANQLSKYIDDLQTIRFLLKNLARDLNGKFFWRFNLNVIAKHYDKILEPIQFEPAIRISTLFLKGSKSNYITGKSIVAIEALFINYKIEVVEDAGHWIHAEQPEKFIDAVYRFLNN